MKKDTVGSIADSGGAPAGDSPPLATDEQAAAIMFRSSGPGDRASVIQALANLLAYALTIDSQSSGALASPRTQ